MRNSKTQDIAQEFINRLSDWFEDPEPSHDDYFASVNQGSLEMAYRALANCHRFRKDNKTAALLKSKD